MRLLDLYCCQGGASVGYRSAGFDVVGVDLEPQPRYPFPFLRMDALEALRFLLDGYALPFGARGGSWGPWDVLHLRLSDFDVIHASPPCQLYSLTHRINRSDFPDLIGPTRELLEQTNKPYVIENVEEARPELRQPARLCGGMFGIETYRHRLFETSFGVEQPAHPEHVAKTTKMGRSPVEGEFMHIVGNFSGVERGRQIMGMPWANRDGLREAIPPVYSEYVGLSYINRRIEMAA